MAKRFTDTEVWKKPWYRRLPPEYKCFWNYILSECSYVGIWEGDFDLASFHIGAHIDPQLAAEIFKDQFISLDETGKWFIKDFIKFQYGESLNEKSIVHKRIIDFLKKQKIKNETLYNILCPTLEATLEPRVASRVKEKEKEKDKEEDKEKEKVKEKEKEVVHPSEKSEEAQLWPTFDDFWNGYDKKVDRQSCEAKWNKLKQQDKESIMAHLPSYRQSTPDKQYRKDPETYLNRRAWENEVIQATGKARNIETVQDRYQQRIARYSSILNR